MIIQRQHTTLRARFNYQKIKKNKPRRIIRKGTNRVHVIEQIPADLSFSRRPAVFSGVIFFLSRKSPTSKHIASCEGNTQADFVPPSTRFTTLSRPPNPSSTFRNRYKQRRHSRITFFGRRERDTIIIVWVFSTLSLRILSERANHAF